MYYVYMVYVMCYLYRYNIQDMKLLCESMLQINGYNWLDLLRVSSMLGCNKLSVDCETYIRQNLQHMSGKHIAQFQSEFPLLYGKIVQDIAASIHDPPSSAYIERTAQVIRDKKKATSQIGSFPLWLVGVLFVLGVIYRYAITTLQLGVYIPVFNVVFSIGVVFYGYFFFKGL